MRIPAIVYPLERRTAARVPAMIVVNGHGGDKYTWYSFWCDTYARGA
jgi:hypothetical protein